MKVKSHPACHLPSRTANALVPAVCGRNSLDLGLGSCLVLGVLHKLLFSDCNTLFSILAHSSLCILLHTFSLYVFFIRFLHTFSFHVFFSSFQFLQDIVSLAEFSFSFFLTRYLIIHIRYTSSFVYNCRCHLDK